MNWWSRFLQWLSPQPGDSVVYSGHVTQGYPGSDPYAEDGTLFRLPAGRGDPDAPVGGGYSQQSYNRRNILTIGGGDTAWYNPGLGCFRALHYGERPIPGRRYVAYIPPRGFSEWLR